MPTLPIRFITSRGPDNSLKPDDLAFLGSEPSYPSVQRMKDIADALKAELSGHELYIYRMSRPGKGLYLWRQSSNSQGEERGDEPPGAVFIGYAIYAAPKGLVDQIATPPDVTKLTEGVLSIGRTFSQGTHGDPGSGGP